MEKLRVDKISLDLEIQELRRQRIQDKKQFQDLAQEYEAIRNALVERERRTEWRSEEVISHTIKEDFEAYHQIDALNKLLISKDEQIDEWKR